MKKTGYIAVAVVIVVFAFIYTSYRKVPANPVISTASTSTSTAEVNTSDWQTYTNEKYGFSYIMPLQKNYADYMAFSQSGFFVSPLQFSSSTPDLKSYAESIRNNSNLPDRPASKLEQTTFNGRTAYSFTRENDAKFTEINILTTNQNNQLFWVHYTKRNNVSEKIFSTLKIDAELIATKVKPDDWQTIKETYPDFEFSYPANIFTEKEDSLISHSVLKLAGKRGNISIYIFKPSDYERVWNILNTKDLKKVKVGNLYGYKSTSGEGGIWGTSFTVSMSDNSTVGITFGSDQSNIYPIANDIDLQNQILSTFKFSTN